MTTTIDVFGIAKREPVEFTPPGATKSVRLRWPSFNEWFQLTTEHRAREGQDPTADMIARTVATCLADDKGGRLLTDEAAAGLLEEDPRALLAVYVKCWETVLKNDDQAVKEVEKN